MSREGEGGEGEGEDAKEWRRVCREKRGAVESEREGEER